MTAPRPARNSATADLPEPIPPVRPMTTTPHILPRSSLATRLTRRCGVDPALFSPRADERLRAAQAVKGRARRALEHPVRDWPPNSPAAINAWLLLATTKPPTWRDNLVPWEDHPPCLGRANEGFYYPDPLGFWAEIRRWALELFQLEHPTGSTTTSRIPIGRGRCTRGSGATPPTAGSWEGPPAPHHPQPLPLRRHVRLPALGARSPPAPFGVGRYSSYCTA